MTTLDRDTRLSIIGGYLAAEPGRGLMPLDGLWRVISDATPYDASRATFHRDFADFQTRIIGDLSGRMAKALLVIDAEIKRALESEERGYESVTALLREQRAILRYDELKAPTSEEPGRRNKYEEERRTWRSDSPVTGS